MTITNAVKLVYRTIRGVFSALGGDNRPAPNMDAEACHTPNVESAPEADSTPDGKSYIIYGHITEETAVALRETLEHPTQAKWIVEPEGQEALDQSFTARHTQPDELSSNSGIPEFLATSRNSGEERGVPEAKDHQKRAGRKVTKPVRKTTAKKRTTAKPKARKKSGQRR